MNSWVKALLIFLLVSAIVFLVFFGYSVYAKIQNGKKAIAYTFTSKKYCDEACQQLGTDLQPMEPPPYSALWSADSVQYAAQLVRQFSENWRAPTGGDIEVVDYLDYQPGVRGAVILRAGDSVWIVFRGSQTKEDFKADADIVPLVVPWLATYNWDVPVGRKKAMAHGGVLKIYNQLREKLLKVSAPHIYVAGHSLGGALAQLAAIDLKLLHKNNVTVGVISFAPPRAGNPALLEALRQSGADYAVSVRNRADVVPFSPPPIVPNPADPESPYYYADMHTKGGAVYFTHQRGNFTLNHIPNTYRDFTATL